MASSSQSNSGSRILRVAASGFALSLLANVFLFVAHLIIPRAISREEYAEFTVSLSFVVLISMLADLGMLHMHTRMFAEAIEEVSLGKPDRRGTLLGSVLLLRLGLSVIVSILVVVLASMLYETEMVTNIAILLIALVVSSRLQVVRAAGESLLRGRGKYYVSSGFILLDAIFLVALLAFKPHPTLRYIVWSYALCYVPGFLMMAIYVGRWIKAQKIRLSIDLRLVVRMLRMALPLSLGTAFFVGFNEGDKILLDRLSTPFEVSNFGAIIRLSTGFALLPLVLGSIVAPEVTRLLVRSDTQRAKRLMDLATRILLIASGAVALVSTVSASDLVPLLLGQKYLSASSLFAWIGWMMVPFFLSSFVAEICIAAGRFWTNTVYMAIIMVFTLSGDFILMPALGSIGAALSRTIALTFGFIYLLYHLRQAEFIAIPDLAHSMLKVGAITACSVAVMFLLNYAHMGSFSILVATLLVYFGSIHFLHVMRFEEAVGLLKRIMTTPQAAEAITADS